MPRGSIISKQSELDAHIGAELDAAEQLSTILPYKRRKVRVDGASGIWAVTYGDEYVTGRGFQTNGGLRFRSDDQRRPFPYIRSAIARLVVDSVTTSEPLVLYVFFVLGSFLPVDVSSQQMDSVLPVFLRLFLYKSSPF